MRLSLDKIPLVSIKEVNEERYWELMEMNHHIAAYNIYSMARSIGIKFNPEHFTVEQLSIISAMHEEVQKHLEKKHGRK